MTILLGKPLPLVKVGTKMEILDTLSFAIQLFEFITSEEAANLFILPVRFIGKSGNKEEN